MFKNKIWNTIQDVAKLEIHPKKFHFKRPIVVLVLCFDVDMFKSCDNLKARLQPGYHIYSNVTNSGGREYSPRDLSVVFPIYLNMIHFNRLCYEITYEIEPKIIIG